MTLKLELVKSKNNNIQPRSGHKLVADDKYIYLLGGYVQRPHFNHTEEVKGEVWRFNLAYKYWEKCEFNNQLFSLGASHSAIMIGDCIFVTGGTGFPFGVNILKSLIVINMKKMTQEMFEFIPKDNKIRNLPIGTYGHTMTYANLDKTPFLFIIGGTTGETYHQEVYQINLLTLESELVSDNEEKDAPKPRYKHDAFLYKDNIYVLGGANGVQCCYVLDIIHKFNIRTRTWTVLKANNPIGMSLRCPSMSQNGRFIYVSGGYPNYDYISDNVFQLDLEGLSWSLVATWDSPSYFHDSVFVPHLGSVFIFGGVFRIMPQKRNNNMYVFEPPTGRTKRTLTDLAWQTVLHTQMPTLEKLVVYSESSDSSVTDHLISLGVPSHLVSRVTLSDNGDFNAA